MLKPTLKRPSINSMEYTYSVILPAYNEEDFLDATLKNLQQAMASIPAKGEIIVVDNNSTDNTKNVARSNGARVVFEPVRQIARARNRGARTAAGNFLIFLDADTMLSPQLLSRALTMLAGNKCCGGGTLLRYDAQLPFLADRLVACWNLISRTCKFAAGSFVFCLSCSFHDIGGFDEQVYAGEEVIFSRKMQLWGKRHNRIFAIIDDQAVITSSRKFQWFSSIRIAMLLLLFTIFPFALRYRSLCNFWYRRPVH